MNKQILISAAILLLTQIGFAQPSDRILIGDSIGIIHSENFEYSCQVKTQASGEKPVQRRLWVDTDFNAQPPYRAAIGWPGGKTVAGTIAVELPVQSFAVGRCPGLCLSLTFEEGYSLTFKEDHKKKITVTGMDSDGNIDLRGRCQLNEPN